MVKRTRNSPIVKTQKTVRKSCLNISGKKSLNISENSESANISKEDEIKIEQARIRIMKKAFGPNGGNFLIQIVRI